MPKQRQTGLREGDNLQVFRSQSSKTRTQPIRTQSRSKTSSQLGSPTARLPPVSHTSTRQYTTAALLPRRAVLPATHHHFSMVLVFIGIKAHGGQNCLLSPEPNGSFSLPALWHSIRAGACLKIPIEVQERATIHWNGSLNPLPKLCQPQLQHCITS